MTTFVRPSQVDVAETGRLLTIGAQGVVYSMISTAADAEAANRAIYYPPRGERGFAGPHGRYARWSSNLAANEDPEHRLFSSAYIKAANDSLATIYCIENDEGLDNLEKILKAGRPDGVMFGIGDYMVSVDFDQSKVAAAKRRMYDICRSNGVGIALNAVPADDLEYYPGCFFAGGVEATCISDAVYTRGQGRQGPHQRTGAVALNETRQDMSDDLEHFSARGSTASWRTVERMRNECPVHHSKAAASRC